MKILPKEQFSSDLIIPVYVEQKIRHLCNKIHNIEWSGILFYKYEGTFEDNNLKIICEDIFPMDIGSGSYTDFNMSPDVINYMTEAGLLDCECGLIHSHHSMAAFFSGTDLSTLEKEGNDRNHFVSLIVNNDGNYVAAITRKMNVKEKAIKELSYNTFNDEKIELGNASCKREYSEVEYSMLNIINRGRTETQFDDIDSRLEELKKAKERKEFKRSNTTSIYEPSLFDDYNYGFPSFNTRRFKDTAKSNTIKSGNQDLVDLTVLRILLGCISVTDTSGYDLSEVAEDIVSVYDEIFNKDDEKFSYWIELFADALFLELYGEDCTFEIISDVIERFNELPTNVYTQRIKECLINYVYE